MLDRNAIAIGASERPSDEQALMYLAGAMGPERWVRCDGRGGPAGGVGEGVAAHEAARLRLLQHELLLARERQVDLMVDLDLQGPVDGLLQLGAERGVVVLLILLALGLKVVVVDQEGELALVALGLVLLLHLVRVDGHLEALNDRRREHVA